MSGLKAKDLDFAAASHVNKKAESSGLGKAILVAVPVALLVAGLGIWLSLTTRYGLYEEEIASYSAQVSAMDEDSQYQTSVMAQAVIQAMEQELDVALQTRNALDSCPDASASLFTTINTAAGEGVELQVVSYNGDEGQIVLMGTAPGISGTAGFVGRLRETGRFDSLEYTGYQEEYDANNRTGATGNYIFTITGMLKGREVVQNAW